MSAPTVIKTKFFGHLNFNSTLKLISGISSDLQKFLMYFNGTAIIACVTIPSLLFGAGWTPISLINLALHLKDLKLVLFVISLLTLVASSSE